MWGGSEEHLLLGIKNTNLDPVWIKTLPSGVVVYQSVVMWLLLSTDDDLQKSQFFCSWEVHGSQAVHEVQYKPSLAEIFLFPFPVIFVYKIF